MVHVKKIFLWMAIGCLGLLSRSVNAEDYREEDPAIDYEAIRSHSTVTVNGKKNYKGRASTPRAAPTTAATPAAPPSPPVKYIEIPSFQLTFSLNSRRHLRKLQSANEYGDQFTHFVKKYLEDNAWVDESLGPKVEYVHLNLKEDSGSVEDGSLTYTFDGIVKVTKPYRPFQYSPTLEEIMNFIDLTFITNKSEMLALSETWSEGSVFTKVSDAEFKWVDGIYADRNGGDTDVEDGETSRNEGDESENNVNIGTSGGFQAGSHIVIDDRDKPTDEKSSFPVAIVGSVIAGAILALTALFSYGYRRTVKNRSNEYEISDSFDHEGDIRPVEHENCVQMMKSRGLSDFASGSSTQSKNAYMGMFQKAWTTTTNKMSDLAAGATQEEFAENGMKIDVYGASSKKPQRKSSSRSLENKKGGEMSSELEPIVEVRSDLSGSELSGAESWQEGNGAINKAPPLLPAMSVSSAPSDDAQLEIDVDSTPILHNSPGDSPEYTFNLESLPVETPLDGTVMDAMTPYADMTNISGSPELDSSSDEDSPIIAARCLDFTSGSVAADLDNSSNRSSSGSCVKDTDMLLEAINPNTCDRSSDGCVKDMLEQMDGMISSSEHGLDDLADGEKESEIIQEQVGVSTPESSTILTEESLIESEAIREEVGVSTPDTSKVLTEENLVELSEANISCQENEVDVSQSVFDKSLGDGNARPPVTIKKRDPYLVELDTNVPLSSHAASADEAIETANEERPSSPMIDVGLD